jgi:hypothetical protein
MVSEGLVLCVGESKMAALKAAKDDLVVKLKGGLPALYYGGIPWIPVFMHAGLTVQFGLLTADGVVRVH